MFCDDEQMTSSKQYAMMLVHRTTNSSLTRLKLVVGGGNVEQDAVQGVRRREHVAAKVGGPPWSTGSSYNLERDPHVSH